MRSLTRAAFAMLLVGTLFAFIGFVLPWWFARGSSRENGVYWNIMYAVGCVNDNCDSEGRILKESKVFLFGTETGVSLEAISILAIISFVFCIFAVILAFIFQFGMCGVRRSYFSIIFGCYICMAISVLLNFITVVLAAVALGDFFDILKVQNAFEFPWSVLMFGIAGLCLGISIVLYTIILSNWKRYRHIYSRERYYFETPDGPIFSVDKPDYYERQNYPRHDSIRRTYAPAREYYVEDRRGDYWDEYRRDYPYNYRENYYRKSYRPYERRYPKDNYRKSGYHYDRYRDGRGTRYERPWHTKVDDVIDEANWLRMTTGNRWRDRDRDYYRY